MDWIDYREKLGIGFQDKEKTSYFCTKLFNHLRILASNEDYGSLSVEEYCIFCNTTGSEINTKYLADYCSSERYKDCIHIINDHNNDLRTLLSYYLAFINSIKESRHKSEEFIRIDYVRMTQNILKESHIPCDIFEENGEYFIFQKGVTEFDDALVSQPLEWLKEYPQTQKEWANALKDYSNFTDEKASDVADKFRKALERFFQEFFNSTKALENLKSEYGTYMKANGIPSEISNNIETLMQCYTNFMNNYAKHHNGTDKNVLEYIMYQTGNIIRLLITLKWNEKGEME